MPTFTEPSGSVGFHAGRGGVYVHPPRPAPLLALSSELLDIILSHLDAVDLASLSATNRKLRSHATSEYHWQRCVQENVPGQKVTKTGLCASFRDLYIALELLWFLPKHKIWFCDRDLTGKMIIVRFDQRRGCIEGHQLLAVSNRATQHWPAEGQIIIHEFDPKVKLHLDKPVLRFHAREMRRDRYRGSFVDEMPMTLGYGAGMVFSNLLLARPLKPWIAEDKMAAGYPYGRVWPPPAVPARHRVSGARPGRASVDLSSHDRPWSKRQVSDQTFRIRQWFELAGSPIPAGMLGQWTVAGYMQGSMGATATHLADEVSTYSTIDAELYTPTETKPWRGIWVGDYSGHGCEFLLINQPDDEPVSDRELGLWRGERETDEAWQKRQRDARIFRGRLEAIKLTGDPNVPRGEFTFVAEDLGPDGLVGTASDAPFLEARGARVVRCKGHVAGMGFVDDKYMESKLLLISHDRLAQYWVEFGHISFFQRVQLDKLLVP